MRICILAGVSMLAMASSAHAQGTTDATAPATQSSDTGQATAPAPDGQEIIVTGIRSSLTRAADVKRNALQVVDSIVADDIGKLPDPTTAAALQRVPGVLVSVNRNNELADVRIRGLPDILTTVNGREVFTTNDRSFNLQDMPAQALARIDVAKSQTADQIEGGLAGTIDLQLNKPFAFRKPTIVATARGNYGLYDKRFGPQLGLLATDRWDTGIGEIGVLLNGSYSKQGYTRSSTILVDRRSSQTTPYNTPGLLFPNVMQDMPQTGEVTRKEFNAALQWQASPSLMIYAEGFYTDFRDRGAVQGFNFQPYTASFGATVVSVTDVVQGDQCIKANVSASGQNPTATDTTAVQTLCQPKSMTIRNAAMNQSSTARDNDTNNKQIAGGFAYDQDGWHAKVDLAYQTSNTDTEDFTINVGQRLATMTVNFDDEGLPHYTTPSGPLESSANLIIRNAFQQNYTAATGSLFQTKIDLAKDFDDSVLKKLSAGARYANRVASFLSVQSSTAFPAPAGNGSPNFGTNEANIVLVSKLGLPSNFLTLSAPTPDLNNGGRALVPSTDFLLSESNLDLIRPIFKLPLGRPAYDPGRQFDAKERTFSSYAQAEYSVPLGGDATLDGVIGLRVIQARRVYDGFQTTTSGANTTYTPLHSDTTNWNVLPVGTMRFRDGAFQSRLSYSKSIRRPDFPDLNPALTLKQSFNPLVQSTGTAGNPNLKDQQSESFDATLEYYIGKGYIALAGYYRNIRDRVITGAALETYGGIQYAISRPRNIGEAKLKGIEVSGQYFFDFLPGALNGLGTQGSFTISDSKIGGSDILAGNPLQGVSKYNYTAGLLYEKFGISGRLVYTWRSKYFDVDRTAQPTLRPTDSSTALVYTRGAGRLDFSVGYDINQAIRIDVGGTNILRSRTLDYYNYNGLKGLSYSTLYDETTYTVGVRVKL
jgi:TonB-dependent receptor